MVLFIIVVVLFSFNTKSIQKKFRVRAWFPSPRQGRPSGAYKGIYIYLFLKALVWLEHVAFGSKTCCFRTSLWSSLVSIFNVENSFVGDYDIVDPL